MVDKDIMLSLKVGVEVGKARRFVVGDPDIRCFDLIAGELLDRLARAEQLAQQEK